MAKKEINISLKAKKKGAKRFYFPSLPEEISYKGEAEMKTYSLLKLGEVRVPRGREPEEISWTHVFFGSQRKKSAVIDKNHYSAPATCVNKIRAWKNNGTKLNLIVAGTGLASSLNIDVVVTSFEAKPYGAYGDVKYTIKLEEYRPIVIYNMSEKKKSTQSTTARTGSRPKTYTTKKGDTLYKIAKKYYKSGSKKKKLAIYKKNKKTIDKALKKRFRAEKKAGKRKKVPKKIKQNYVLTCKLPAKIKLKLP